MALAALIASVWLFSRDTIGVTAAGATTAPLPRPAAVADPPGFRADAWFLPDEELLGFVEIPAGPFLMGSDPAMDPQSFENERWANGVGHGSIDLPTYFIGRYEVTVGQFRAFVGATGHRVDPGTLAAPDNHPVALVSWPDALAYARWLEGRLKESPATPARLREALNSGWRVSLPTEAEWEKAARGTDGRIFPWGNEPSRDHANFQGRGASPVGTFSCDVCPYGLADMAGNVWEWTRSPYQANRYGETDEGPDLEADALWVMRGGSFEDPINLVRSAVRGGGDPGVRRPMIGFRLAISRF